LALPYGFLPVFLSNPGLSPFRLLPLNPQVVGRYYILEPQLDRQKLGRQSTKAFSITSKAAAAKADSGRKMKTGNKGDMPLCLGYGKTRTAALGAITSSSYYQATPCPSTKIDDLAFL
jgi:hypothetical protein